jgi:hypothetical protein
VITDLMIAVSRPQELRFRMGQADAETGDSGGFLHGSHEDTAWSCEKGANPPALRNHRNLGSGPANCSRCALLNHSIPVRPPRDAPFLLHFLFAEVGWQATQCEDAVPTT